MTSTLGNYKIMRAEEILSKLPETDDVKQLVKTIRDGRFTMDGSDIEDFGNDGMFAVSSRDMISLVGCPQEIPGNFYCRDNLLTTLIGGPSNVLFDYVCFNNRLTNLEGIASYIGRDLTCFGNKLTDLHNIHQLIEHIGGSADFSENNIKSHVLGLLKIEALKKVMFRGNLIMVEKIINTYLKGNRDILDCQEELIEGGFDDFAQL